MTKYGKLLLAELPDNTTRLLQALCTDWVPKGQPAPGGQSVVVQTHCAWKEGGRRPCTSIYSGGGSGLDSCVGEVHIHVHIVCQKKHNNNYVVFACPTEETSVYGCMTA